jgi:site-specific DNA-methyltransferase (adenine-specific)/modification methylase
MILKQEILSPNCTILCGDCKEVIPQLQFDAVVTDPPYGISFNHKRHLKCQNSYTENGSISRNNKPIIGDNVRFDCTHLIELQGRLSSFKIGSTSYERPIALFGANHFCKDIPEHGSWITWDKSCGQGPSSDFTDAEYIWVNRVVKRCIFRHVWMGAIRVGQDSSNNTKRSHPSMKPVELMAWLIESIRIGLGKTVLDPYMGVGSTGVACLQSGRKFIGIEIDPEYYEIAKSRLLAEINRQQPVMDFKECSEEF